MFKPELPHHCTESQPFSFDGRDKEMKQRKDEAIKAIILEEEKKVHAGLYLCSVKHVRTVPTIVIVHTFCTSPDTRISYR